MSGHFFHAGQRGGRIRSGVGLQLGRGEVQRHPEGDGLGQRRVGYVDHNLIDVIFDIILKYISVVVAAVGCERSDLGR